MRGGEVLVVFDGRQNLGAPFSSTQALRPISPLPSGMEPEESRLGVVQEKGAGVVMQAPVVCL